MAPNTIKEQITLTRETPNIAVGERITKINNGVDGRITASGRSAAHQRRHLTQLELKRLPKKN
jgi:hypothetical protein